jgi:hypothetical protein
MRTAASLFVAAVVAIVAVPAFAQGAPAPGDVVVVQEPDRVVYRARTSMSFTDAEIRGVVVGPTYERHHPRGKVTFRNLIELRSSFRPELAKSPGQL